MKALSLRIPASLKRAVGKRKKGPPRVTASIEKIDANATPAAATSQSAEDAAARRSGIPADQGGEG